MGRPRGAAQACCDRARVLRPRRQVRCRSPRADGVPLAQSLAARHLPRLRQDLCLARRRPIAHGRQRALQVAHFHWRRSRVRAVLRLHAFVSQRRDRAHQPRQPAPRGLGDHGAGAPVGQDPRAPCPCSLLPPAPRVRGHARGGRCCTQGRAAENAAVVQRAVGARDPGVARLGGRGPVQQAHDGRACGAEQQQNKVATLPATGRQCRLVASPRTAVLWSC
eukprot:Amastigsp_a509361_54.p2 type:complete len:221 gc:universal Amastigsp_a509361_54:1-663(+)